MWYQGDDMWLKISISIYAPGIKLITFKYSNIYNTIKINIHTIVCDCASVYNYELVEHLKHYIHL